MSLTSARVYTFDSNAAIEYASVKLKLQASCAYSSSENFQSPSVGIMDSSASVAVSEPVWEAVSNSLSGEQDRRKMG